jgi:hypothetical protein
MGLPGMVLSAIATAVGAIMYWPSPIKVRVFAVSRSPQRSNQHSMDRQVVDAQGNTSSVHEDSK